MFEGSTTFVSGGSGSWGQELTKQLLEKGPEKIIIFSRGELAQVNMQRKFNDPRIEFIIGDVRDYGALSRALKGVDFAFHMAALKHVPVCENHPQEAIKTNIDGTTNLVNAAIENGVKKVIDVSCYDEHTRLVTKNGLKKYSEITEDDTVFSINPKTGVLEESSILGINIQNYEGEMIHFKNKRVDLMVTPNHKIFYKTPHGRITYRLAEDVIKLKKGLALLKGEWHKKIKSKVFNSNKILKQTVFVNKYRRNLLPEEILVSDLFYLTGLYISDGFLNCGNSVVLCLPSADPANEKAKKILQQWGLPVNIIKNHDGFLEFSCKGLHDFWETCGSGAENKHIPEWMLAYPVEFLLHLYEGLIDGDGYVFPDKNGAQYTTVSSKLKDDITELFIKLSLEVYVKVHPPKKVFIVDHYAEGKEVYYIYGRKRTKNLYPKKHNKISYKGVVWCVTVPFGNILVERNGFYLFSGNTDKSVSPTNLYGMTKAVGEKLVIQANNLTDKTDFVCIRAGNVLGSNGSVVPLFIDQIARYNKVTITCGYMTRYFMTLPEAIHLLFKAAACSVGGETFVMHMPAFYISTLSEVLVDHYGNKDTKIEEIGIREGEKIDELLISEHEATRSVVYDNDYYVIKTDLKINRDYSHLNDKPKVPFTSYSSSYEIKGYEVLKDLLDRGGFLK